MDVCRVCERWGEGRGRMHKSETRNRSKPGSVRGGGKAQEVPCGTGWARSRSGKVHGI